MLIITMLFCKVMNSLLLYMCKQTGEILFHNLESVLAIHKRMEGQCSVMEKRTDFGVSSGMETV